MKVECILEKLKTAILQTERITGKNLTLPILSSILITAEKSSLKLRSTNLSVGIEVEVPAKIQKEGLVAINGSVLQNIFSNLKGDDSVKLESINENLSIKTESASMVVKCNPSGDFPTLPKVSGKEFIFPSLKFIEGVKSISYSAAISDIKPEISSVYISSDDDTIVFVATDSFRLAEKKIKIKKASEFPEVLIPVKNINEVIRIFEEENSDIKISIGENQISFQSEEVYCTSRVIDGVFPDYKQIMPSSHKTEVITLKTDVTQALKMVNIFSDKFNQIDITVKPKEKICKLHSKNADVGESETNLNASLSGEEISTSINHRYLSECLQSISQDSVIFQLSESNKPIVIKGVSDDSFTYLIMPMNR